MSRGVTSCHVVLNYVKWCDVMSRGVEELREKMRGLVKTGITCAIRSIGEIRVSL